MQLNTLNRVISLFLIGGFVVFLSAVYLREEIGGEVREFGKKYELGPSWGPTAGVFLTVGLLSATALAGAIVDALGNITVRRFIRKILGRYRFMAWLFLCAGEFAEQARWREAFKVALGNSSKYRSLGTKKEMLNPLSAGLFFRTAQKEHAEWLIQHHSMYHLSADFVVVLIVGATFAGLRDSYYLACGSIAAAYLLTTFALDNYLYTYQLSFRNAYLALMEGHEREPSTGGVASNPRPQPDRNRASPGPAG
jgi:hypothetical protein